MSDQGEKTCPLCAEEMDLTDQQLKPCKCGYDICVWCWHHILDMAEKDGTAGRCPACRTLYNKEKIVGTSAKFERAVAEMGMEKKMKAKPKNKTSDGRKQLSSVRVVQRNLVYVMGLALDLADEDLLQGKEYFAQYGKVLKVSISRTSGGSIQQFPNNTCSVYITYSKEEEAVRCIQSVHGFSLEGRPLRACFGTTKYCHAWLRNVPCNNPDCLYLHEIGSHEVSFTKDETISAYTRSNVQQITGATYDTQRRSGNVLPPPADGFCNNSNASLGKPIDKISSANTDIQSENILGASVWQTPASSVRNSPPKSSSGRSVGLPAAAWGVRTSNSQPLSVSVASLNGPSKQKSDTCSASISFSTAVANPSHVSAIHVEARTKTNEAGLVARQKGRLESAVSENMDQRTASNNSAIPEHPVTSVPTTQNSKSLIDNDESVNMSHNRSCDNFDQSYSTCTESESNTAAEGEIQKVCSDMLSLHIDGPHLQQRISEQHKDPVPSNGSLNAISSCEDKSVMRKHSELRLLEQKVAESVNCEVEDDLLLFNLQRLKDPEVGSHQSYLPSLSRSYSNASKILPAHVNFDPLIVNNKEVDKDSLHNNLFNSNGYMENQVKGFIKSDNYNHNSYMLSDGGKHAADDTGESSIISNILSMDFDPWDESLSSPRNMAKLLGEVDKQQGHLGVSNSWKVPTSNQSRFSFAREDVEVPNFETYFSSYGKVPENNHSFRNGLLSNGEYYHGKTSDLSAFSAEDHGSFANIHSLGSNKFSVSKALASAPPGFSGPTRAPPPGFTARERMIDPNYDMHSGGYSLEQSSLLRKTYQAPPPINIGNDADIEFMDPAILAVGKGRLPDGLNGLNLDMRSGFPQQIYASENEAQVEFLMQRSRISHRNQNHRYGEMSGIFSSHSDYHGIPSRRMDQSVAKNLSPFSQFSHPQSSNQLISNGNWDVRNEVQGGTQLTMAELLRAERLGINKLINGYEDSNYQLAGSSNMYNQSYGI